MRNVFACLAHESPDCVVDVVRNLRYCDPDSEILLYNGGADAWLFSRAPALERLGAIVHPRPRELAWGRLHDFALDSMRFALSHLGRFDTFTIVDSDQLALRPGYSRFLADALAASPEAGLLGTTDRPLLSNSRVGPVRAAWREVDLWRPFLDRFPDGRAKFVHWTFWPATVFTAQAAADLVRLFDRDDQLLDILERTQIWATEEVILPTLVALLGHEVRKRPGNDDCVGYRTRYTGHQIDRAMLHPDAFWVHPVPRRYGDPLRTRVRDRLDHYRFSAGAATELDGSELDGGALDGRSLGTAPPRDARAATILDRLRGISGWLEDGEAELLMTAAARAARELPSSHAVVEIGSYCGRSTVVLASVAELLDGDTKVYAIDPHDGVVGSQDQPCHTAPTLEQLRRNLAAFGLGSRVEVMVQASHQVAWDRPIGLLFIDGLHDYPNVSRDFLHFEPWIAPGAYVAFHDYAPYWPGVQAFVDELVASGPFMPVARAGSLMVLRRAPRRAVLLPASTSPPASFAETDTPEIAGGSSLVPAASPLQVEIRGAFAPLVSCIMPTRNRRLWVPGAVDCFLSQDYPRLELVVLDDGSDPIADLLPSDPRIRYFRLSRRVPLGAKRNLACRAAAGDIIVHWDDDDWSAPWRVGYQVRSLLDGGAPMNGLDRVLFYNPRTVRAWWYVHPGTGPPWLCGGTLCYRKELWRSHPFRPINCGEDARFVRQHAPGRSLEALPRNDFYVASIHAGNTNPRRTSQARWHQCSVEKVREVVGDAAPEIWTALAGRPAMRRPLRPRLRRRVGRRRLRLRRSGA